MYVLQLVFTSAIMRTTKLPRSFSLSIDSDSRQHSLSAFLGKITVQASLIVLMNVVKFLFAWLFFCPKRISVQLTMSHQHGKLSYQIHNEHRKDQKPCCFSSYHRSTMKTEQTTQRNAQSWKLCDRLHSILK